MEKLQLSYWAAELGILNSDHLKSKEDHRGRKLKNGSSLPIHHCLYLGIMVDIFHEFWNIVLWDSQGLSGYCILVFPDLGLDVTQNFSLCRGVRQVKLWILNYHSNGISQLQMSLDLFLRFKHIMVRYCPSFVQWSRTNFFIGPLFRRCWSQKLVSS